MPFPDAPEPLAIAMLLLTVLALFLFTREKIPLETSSLVIMGIIGLAFALFPTEYQGSHVEASDFFYGFGHEALIAVIALMVIGQGLVRTGALDPVGHALAKLWELSPTLSLLATLVVGAAFSAVVNNTPIVVLLLPILISVSMKTNSSPSGILMPMGFATLLGGMATTIGTSTNLLVVSVAHELGQPRFDLFAFVVPAAIAGGVGILYLWLIAPRLLPNRYVPAENQSPRLFSAHLHLDEDSTAVGKQLADALKLTAGKMRIGRLRRGSNFLVPLPDVLLRPGDRLFVSDTPANLRAFEMALGARMYSGDVRIDEQHPLTAGDQRMAEIAIVSGSIMDGSSLRYAQFIERYQLVVIALNREGREVWTPGEDIADIRLAAGDVLLVQGPKDELARLRQDRNFLVLDAIVELPLTAHAPIAIAILAAVVISAALSIVPIAVAAVVGATAMILTGCLGWGAAVRAISPSVLFVVAASLALGKALLVTEATDWVTHVFLAGTFGAPPWAIVSGLMLLMGILTNIISNNAAAVIGTPIAIGIATELGLPAEPFILAVLFGANMSYATPMAYKTNLLVMSAGHYTFGDFLKVGIPLTILMWATLSVVLPLLYLP